MTTARTLEIVADSLAELKLTHHIQIVRQAAAELNQRDAELAELRKVVNLKTEALISVIAEIEGGDGITVASQYLKDASQAWVKGGEKV